VGGYVGYYDFFGSNTTSLFNAYAADIKILSPPSGNVGAFAGHADLSSSRLGATSFYDSSIWPQAVGHPSSVQQMPQAKTIAELQNPATFTDWGSSWQIVSGQLPNLIRRNREGCGSGPPVITDAVFPASGGFGSRLLLPVGIMVIMLSVLGFIHTARRKKTRVSKTAALLLSCIAVSGATACASTLSVGWAVVSDDSTAQIEEQSSVSEEHSFAAASFEEAVNLLEEGTGVLVLASPDHPLFQYAFPVLEEAFNEMNRNEVFGEKILYYDISYDSEADNERYQTLADYTKTFLAADEHNNHDIHVPNIYFIRSGEIIGSHTSAVPNETDPDSPLDERQKSELLGIYRRLMIMMNAKQPEEPGC
jgi:hypothetical protein